MGEITQTSAYYRRREADELKMAGAAATDAIQKIHMELAEKYRSLAEEAETVEPTRRIRDG